jgi:hypothetical protein
LTKLVHDNHSDYLKGQQLSLYFWRTNVNCPLSSRIV